MKTISKTSLITLVAVAAVAAAPQAAFAHTTKKAHTHKSSKTVKKSSHHTHTVAGVPVSSTDAKLRQLESEIQALRGELGKTRSETKSAVAAVAQKADAQDAAIDAKLVKHEEDTVAKNTLFFRGGYASMTHPRNDELLTAPNAVDHNQGNGWYVGAGIDHRLTNNLWGMTDLIAVDGELMFQYMNFGQSTNTLVSVYPGASLPGAVGIMRNQITQFTLAASPKIKFNTGTIFTPWVIPFGLSMNVISPPSSGVTVLNPGLMLGVGGEAEFMKAFVAGVDFRYNFTGGDLSYNSTPAPGTVVRVKGMSTDGLTAGGYFGFKF